LERIRRAAKKINVLNGVPKTEHLNTHLGLTQRRLKSIKQGQ